MDVRKPVLCIVAGPNGSGKTSTTVQLLRDEWSEGCFYINPDNIALEQFGDWNAPDAVLSAAKEATRLRYACLEERRDFVFETVFSSKEKVDFVLRAHELGYFIRIFFVCTESPEINVRRITSRYLNGGHEVPISKVFSRYFKSLANMAEVMAFADRCYFYDNSVEDVMPSLLFRTTEGRLAKQYRQDLPEWAVDLLEIAR